MITPPDTKYRPFPPVHLPDRQWPNRVLTQAPIWCSVDLRDGNQALETPMDVPKKLELFQALVKCGFKEIEVGFPAASNTEYAFIRRLIEENLIPADVTIQVLVQAREDLIERTVESLQGAPKVIIHLYNSTSPAQRRVVFGMDQAQIREVAVRGATWIADRIGRLEKGGTKVMLQYSPESFSATEVEFAKEVAEAVMDIWQPTPERKMILNLPDTVEVAMPNVYADQIEWMSRNIRDRDSLIISLHTHNDRGTGVAATEMGLLAGADRVEGTLFGNGERTGNLDLIIVALNLYMHGIAPELDFSNINALRRVYEQTTGMTVPARHPYSGELVFTAFSGSHQDAIKKGLAERERQTGSPWDVPYLTIDPEDIGRHYKEVIRVNSQSGKGGVAWLVEQALGLRLPKALQREFGAIASEAVDRLGREVRGEELKTLFEAEYFGYAGPWSLGPFRMDSHDGKTVCEATLFEFDEKIHGVRGEGSGLLSAFANALKSVLDPGMAPFQIADFHEDTLSSGTDARAVAYVQVKYGKDQTAYGIAINPDAARVQLQALLVAINRSFAWHMTEQATGITLPPRLREEFDHLANWAMHEAKRRFSLAELEQLFAEEYLAPGCPVARAHPAGTGDEAWMLTLPNGQPVAVSPPRLCYSASSGDYACALEVRPLEGNDPDFAQSHGQSRPVTAEGQTLQSALCAAIAKLLEEPAEIVEFERGLFQADKTHNHAPDAKPVSRAYILLRFGDGKLVSGLGLSAEPDQEIVRAVFSAVRRRQGSLSQA